MSYTDDVAASLAAITAVAANADADLATITGQLATATDGLTAYAAQVVSLDAQVASLEAQLAAAPPSIPLQVMYGLDANTNDRPGVPLQQVIDELRAVFGTAGPFLKIFDGGKGAPAVLAALKATDYGSRPFEWNPVLCLKSINQADVDALLDYALTRFAFVYICVDQEVDDDIGKSANPTAALAKYIGDCASMAAIIRTYPRVAQLFCSNYYYVSHNPKSVANFKAEYEDQPTGTFAKACFDYYPTRASDIKADVAAMAAVAHDMGVPWRLTEFCYVLSAGEAASVGATVEAQVIALCAADPLFEGANRWVDPTGFALLGTPCQAVWAALVGH